MENRIGVKETVSLLKQRVVIVMGSLKDRDHGEKIAKVLESFGVEFDVRIASAHKTIEFLLEIVEGYNKQTDYQTVFIAVAGRSNALGGIIDQITPSPVTSCPPYSESFSGADIYSSLRMPSGSAAPTILEPEGAALNAIKMLALNNPKLHDKYVEFQKDSREKIIQDDSTLNIGSSPR